VSDVKKSAVLVVLAFAAGCSDPPPKPADPPKPAEAPKTAAPKASKPGMAPPISDAQWTAIKAAFVTARGYGAEADKLRTEGANLERTQGRAAANDTLVKAKELYHKAVEAVSDWTDGDLGGKITDAQVKDYLGEYMIDVGKWQKAMSEMSKVHKD
jgi:hypothetical protein